MRELNEQGQQPAGPPLGRHERAERGFFVVARFPTRAPSSRSGESRPERLAARLLYRGQDAGSAAGYDAAQEWLSDHGYRGFGQPWESYLDGPEVAQPRTILQPRVLDGQATEGTTAEAG